MANNALLVKVTRLDFEENFVNQALLGLFSLIIVVIRATVLQEGSVVSAFPESQLEISRHYK